MSPLISVIVPVYNSERYIKDCIESIINQTYANIEIILVDDGSEDRSEEICDEYAKKDKRVIVIHKNNGGSISARKAGVKVAKGEYIGFVDSDDWIDPDMYERLYNESRDGIIDVISSGYIIEDINTSTDIRATIPSGVYCSQEDMRFIIDNMISYKISNKHGITYSMCNKLFRKTILDEVIFNVDDDCTYAEDAACTFLFLIKCSSVSVVDEAYYHYRRHQMSKIHSYDEKYLIGINKLYILLKREFEKIDNSKVLLDKLETFIIIQIIKGINYYMGFSYNVSLPLYRLPLWYIKPGSRIVLYGAGKVGKSYYKQLQYEKNYNTVLWVDQKYDQYSKNGLDVYPIDKIKDMSYDIIIIASLYKEVADNIKAELIEKGIDRDKIVWYEPLPLV